MTNPSGPSNFTIRLTLDEHRRLEKAGQASYNTPAFLIRAKLFIGKFPEARIASIELD